MGAYSQAPQTSFMATVKAPELHTLKELNVCCVNFTSKKNLILAHCSHFSSFDIEKGAPLNQLLCSSEPFLPFFLVP